MTNVHWTKDEFRADLWDDLNAQRGGLPCLDAFNVQLLLQHFGRGDERVWVCRCRHTDSVVAMTVLKGRFIRQTFQPSNQPIGLWLHRQGFNFETLVRTLARQCGGLMLSILQLDMNTEERPEYDHLEVIDYIETPRIRVLTPFDKYMSERAAKHRSNLRNRAGKVGQSTRLECITEPDRIGAAVDDYGKLESRGWKGAEGTAVHPSNSQGRYYRELFERWSQTGAASVWQYWYGDSLVASDLCVHRNGIFIVLKTTFDEQHKSTAPSQLMRREMFERLWAEGRTDVIEFYGRFAEWHRAWCDDDTRIMYHVNAYRWGWLRALRRKRVPRWIHEWLH